MRRFVQRAMIAPTTGGSDSGGGELEIYIEGSPTLVRSNATKIAYRAFYDMSSLVTADFPNVTTIGNEAFYSCDKLTTANFPLATTIGSSAFNSCTNLTTVDLPKATSIDDYAFYCCDGLTTVDFPFATTIGEQAFCNGVRGTNPTALKTLILRSETLCDMHISAVVDTKIISIQGMPTGEGFIYVPNALYESYIADFIPKIVEFATANGVPMDESTATYLATMILRKIEDYTVDGTRLGALDESKI